MNLKSKIYSIIEKSLVQKIEQAKSAIASAKETRDNDTKSSAGDKYETGREMMQAEIDKNEAQLSKNLQLINSIKKIDLNRKYGKIEFGSLVETNYGLYFISIANPKITIGQKDIFSVSLASPLGKALFKKQVGDKVMFNQREFIIENIV